MKGMRPSVLTAGFVVLKSSEAMKKREPEFGDPEKKRKLTVLYGVGLGTGNWLQLTWNPAVQQMKN